MCAGIAELGLISVLLSDSRISVNAPKHRFLYHKVISLVTCVCSPYVSYQPVHHIS